MTNRRSINQRVANQGVRIAGAGHILRPSESPQDARRAPGEGERVFGGTNGARGAQKRRNGDGRAMLLTTVSEAAFQAHVLRVAKRLGYRSYHTWTSKHSAAGFPDLVLVRRPRLIWAELKREGEVPTDAQQAWIDDLRACGQEVYVWRPADADELERILSDDA